MGLEVNLIWLLQPWFPIGGMFLKGTMSYFCVEAYFFFFYLYTVPTTQYALNTCLCNNHMLYDPKIYHLPPILQPINSQCFLKN